MQGQGRVQWSDTQSAGPSISVVIPFQDPRGRPEHLASWTRGQTLAGARYEIIVVAHENDAHQEALREQLRPGDRLLLTAATGPFAMYAVGAEAARGEILFFSEDHCIADRGCLEAVARYLADASHDGGSVRWGHINRTEVARMEQLVSEIDARVWFQEGHWNRVRSRGFAIRRSVYLAAGGFAAEYGLFAEAILAARLHAQGRRVGYIAESGVRHINSLTLTEIRANIEDYSRHECLYLSRQNWDFCESYFAASTVVQEATPLAAAAAWWMQTRAVAAALLAAARSYPTAIPALVGELLHAPWRLARCAWSSRLASRLALLTARWRYAFWNFNERRQLAAFRDHWQAVVRWTRANYFAQTVPPAAPPLWAAHQAIPLTQLPGPYPVEEQEGRPVRWTKPVATWRLNLSPGAHDIHIDTRALRGPTAALPIWFWWNGTPIPRAAVACQEGWLRIRVASKQSTGDAEQHLTIVTPATRLPGCGRRLGLPVGELRIVMVGQATVPAAEFMQLAG
ncbi:MAG: hypothetical protein JNM56_10690 [Planctomycetia bacterium]|nr:hypothetical protein [Planctomycetia bacterium]